MRGIILSSGLLLVLLGLSVSVSGIAFLEWGDQCKIPKIGGGDALGEGEECDAGKGLVCTGQACECTYKQRYSYDHVSKECRRRVGKPCVFVDIQVHGQEALNKLPFNVKCHASAECAQLDLPAFKFNPGGVVDIEKVSMCVCKEGYVASSDLNSCVVPPPPIVEFNISPKSPPKKLIFRAPYYTQ